MEDCKGEVILRRKVLVDKALALMGLGRLRVSREGQADFKRAAFVAHITPQKE